MSEPFYDPSERSDDDLAREEFEAAMRPTPLTDEFFDGIGVYGIGRPTAYEFACDLERQLAEAREEIGRIRNFATVNGVAELERQLVAAIRERDNAISDWRQADSDTVRALHERNEAREQRDALAEALKKACAYPVCGNWYEDAQSALDALKETTQEP